MGVEDSAVRYVWGLHSSKLAVRVDAPTGADSFGIDGTFASNVSVHRAVAYDAGQGGIVLKGFNHSVSKITTDSKVIIFRDYWGYLLGDGSSIDNSLGGEFSGSSSSY